LVDLYGDRRRTILTSGYLRCFRPQPERDPQIISQIMVLTVILSGHDGDDAKPYQEKAVNNLLAQIEIASRRFR
jgi:hypothetical protein